MTDTQKAEPMKGFAPTPDTMYAHNAGKEITDKFQEIIGEYNMQEIIARHVAPVLAKLERLRLCHETELGVCYQHCDEVIEKVAEIERLREVLTVTAATKDTALSEIAIFKAEVERLKNRRGYIDTC